MSIKLKDIEIKHERQGDMEFFKARMKLQTERQVPSRQWMKIPINQMEETRAVLAMESRNAILSHIYGDLVEPINVLFKMAQTSPDYDETEFKRVQAECRAVFNGTTYEEEREH